MSGFNFEDGGIYKIINHKSEKVVGIDGEDKNEDNGREVIIFTDTSAEDQLFLAFKSNDGSLMFASKKSGKVIGVYGEDANTQEGAKLIQWTASKTAKDQIWQTESIPDSLYKIVNYNSGLIAGVHGDTHNTENGQPLILWPYTDADDQKWTFDKRDSISIPPLPEVETLPECPQYKNSPYENLPDQYPQTPVLTHVARIPYLFVSDHGMSPKTQIQTTPYYTIEKREQWSKQSTKVIPPGRSEKIEYTVGITDEIQKTLNAELGFQIGSDAGIDLKGILTAKMNWQLTARLGYTVSNTTKIMESIVREQNQVNPFKSDFAYTEYVKEITLTLKRIDGETTVNSYTYTDPTTIKAVSYSSDEPKNLD